MKDLFGIEIVEPEKAKGNNKAVDLHSQLIAIHGVVEGKKCGNCAYLITKQYSGRYFKCMLSGALNSNPKTDWRKGWQACGRLLEQKK